MQQRFNDFPASAAVEAFVMQAETQLRPVFERIEETEAHNQWKVLQAFHQEQIAQRHFAPTTGYGYDDIGRDALERVFASAFGAEDALVRPHMVNGTHAIYTALSGILRPGDAMLSITGKPYDTMEQAIGIEENKSDMGSLRAFGIRYQEVPLHEGAIDLPAIRAALENDSAIKLIYVQRSRGYAWREAFSCEQLRCAFDFIRSLCRDIIILVDNCYGEFTEILEPCAVGADVIAGSLIKNPGGGLAPSGGYIAGKAMYVEHAANRLTVPGIGKEVGSYAGSYLPFYQGLFLAPHVTAQSLKTAALFARVFENAGMISMPHSEAKRADIIQAVQFHNDEALISFVQSIQRIAPVDSFVIPMPWNMPGYQDQVIMAAGTFIQGASIELSADAPVRAPYIAYIQGALTYAHGKIAAMYALEALNRAGEIKL